MHRAGFFPHNYAAAYTALKQSESVENIVKFSHFACADEPENGMTEMQLEAFDLACEGLEGEESLANSAAILNVPEARRDWGRAGLALYGISPFGGVDERLKPVMRLTSRVFGSDDVGFLECVGAEQCGGHLAGDCDEGDGVHVCVCDCGQQVGCAGAGGCDAHAGLTINDGERIAQMVIARHEQAEFVEVEELDETERGVQ